MLSAIDAVGRWRPDSTAKPSPKLIAELEEAGPGAISDPTSDADALAAIDRALSKAGYSGRL
jgi:hypothetical protein